METNVPLLSADREINEKQLAARWGMKAGTLRYWRSIGKGPVYNKRGGKVTYSMSDILAYEAANKVYPKSS